MLNNKISLVKKTSTGNNQINFSFFFQKWSNELSGIFLNKLFCEIKFTGCSRDLFLFLYWLLDAGCIPLIDVLMLPVMLEPAMAWVLEVS